MNDFTFINPSLCSALQKEQITVPTEVQAAVIPLALENKDLIVQSQTGTGKTLAYLLPLFERLSPAGRETKAIILTPTHELAIQIQRQIELLASNSGIALRSVPIIGNVNILRQIEKLKTKPQIVVGSSGRILELIRKKKITAHAAKTIIVDEADKMMDKSNIESVRAVIGTTLRDRQLLFFSASISPSTIEAAKLLMKKPELIRCGDERSIPSSIEHTYFFAEERDKIEALVKLARIIQPPKAMIFINREYDVDVAMEKLKFHGFSVGSIYGGNQKFERRAAMEDFRAGRTQYLIASDIAARGLQIDGVTCVFNVTMPEDPLDYQHRAGRTGRNGMQGQSVSIITPREQARIRLYEKKFHIPFHAKKMFGGRIVDLVQPGSKKEK